MKYILSKNTGETILIGASIRGYRFLFYTNEGRTKSTNAWRVLIDETVKDGGHIRDDQGNIIYPDEFWAFVEHIQPFRSNRSFADHWFRDRYYHHDFSDNSKNKVKYNEANRNAGEGHTSL